MSEAAEMRGASPGHAAKRRDGMCKWGTDIPLNVFIPAALSHTDHDRFDAKPIDACIAPLVQALNDIGWTTVASCCGHGERPAEIKLLDGRSIIILGEGDGHD